MPREAAMQALMLMQQATKLLQESYGPEDAPIEEIEEAPMDASKPSFSPENRKAKYNQSRKRVRSVMKEEEGEDY